MGARTEGWNLWHFDLRNACHLPTTTGRCEPWSASLRFAMYRCARLAAQFWRGRVCDPLLEKKRTESVKRNSRVRHKMWRSRDFIPPVTDSFGSRTKEVLSQNPNTSADVDDRSFSKLGTSSRHFFVQPVASLTIQYSTNR